MTGESRTRPWRRIGVAVAALWVATFAYLLFVDDPPDFFWDDIAEVDGPAHFVGGAVTGLIAYLLVANRRRAILVALGAMVAVVVGLEVLQDLFSSRKWENSDVGLALVGGVIGVVAGPFLARLFKRGR